jgi:hypothetical protein
MIEAPHVESPKPVDIQAPEFPPGTATNHGCDGIWDWDHGGSQKITRQTPLIEIAEEDGISDSGTEVYNFMQQHGIIKLLIMGVFTSFSSLLRKPPYEYVCDGTVIRYPANGKVASRYRSGKRLDRCDV